MKMDITGHDITWGGTYWPYWLCTVVVTFLAPEIFALYTNAGNTLSDFIWRSLRPNSAVWYLSLGVWVTLTSWLVFHFWFRRFR